MNKKQLEFLVNNNMSIAELVEQMTKCLVKKSKAYSTLQYEKERKKMEEYAIKQEILLTRPVIVQRAKILKPQS